jgi:hypothetical protein
MRISAKEKKMKRFLSIGAAFMVKAAVSAAMPMVLLTFALVLAACGTLFSISSAVNTAGNAGETGSGSASTKRRAENSLNTFSRGTDRYQVRFANDEFVIVQYQGSSGKVAIPAEFDGVPVVAIEENAFDRHPEITSITIPASVIRIGADVNDAEDAFDGCAGLTDITVAEENEIYSSEDGVLFDKDKTTLLLCPQGKSGSYTIPASVTSIVDYAFEDCGRLTGVTIPDSVTSIGAQAFSRSTGLTSVTIPNSVTSIGERAFYECTGLTSITIPNSVTSIGERAFAMCEGLTSITIPASIETVAGDFRDGSGYGVFFRCTGLKSVIISEGVTSIGATAFYECTGLTSITIPNSVTSIGEMAFSGCGALTSVTIPNSVTYIGGNAFADCTRLTSVTVSPVAGRVWDDTTRGYSVFTGSSRVNDASKTALRNAGYTGGF